MKKIFLVLLFLFVLLSCRKNAGEPAPSSTDILKEFRWEKVKTHSYRFPPDTSRLITYTDTIKLLFDETQFNRSTQNTIVQTIFSNGAPQFHLQKITTATKGDYRFQSIDSTLQLTYQTKYIGNPPWNVMPRDTIIQETYKVLRLDKERLHLRLLPQAPIFIPYPDIVDTFRAVPR